MNAITTLEKLGYRFQLAIDYTGPNTPPAEADTLLSELASHKLTALLYLAERGMRPSNTITSERCRTAITKGILAAQSPHELLVKAMEWISRMTGDTVFYDQGRENIKAIYGAGLLDPVPLEMELAEVRKRLAMLTRPELDAEPEDSRRRIGRAVKAHREREAQLLSALER